MQTTTNFKKTIALTALAVLTVACGGGTTSTDGTTASTVASTTTATEGTTTTTVPATTTSPTEATTTTVAETTTTTVAESTTTTAAPVVIEDAPPGAVIITADDGIYYFTWGTTSLLLEYSTPPEFDSDLIDFAISDTRGGVIIQPDRAPFVYKGSDSIVYWIPAGATAPQQLLVPAADQGLQLEDVVAQGDAVSVYYTRLEGSTPEDMLQTLRQFDLDSKTVTPLADVAGWESGTWNYSVGGSTIAHSWSGEAYYGIEFRDGAGTVFDWPFNPGDELFDCFPTCPVGPALNEDGSRFAYVEVSGGSHWVTILNTSDGSTFANFELSPSFLGPDPFSVHSMDYSDDHLVINRVVEGSEWYMRPVLIELSDGGIPTLHVLDQHGLARLTDVVPSLGGVVQYP